MKDEITKKFSIKAKDLGDQGKVKAIIATLGTLDKDHDVTMPGFFGIQKAVVVPVHDWNHVPIGKCSIAEDGSEVIADIQLNMDIQAAKDWLAAMKFDLADGNPLMEWSYGFKILPGGASEGEFNGQHAQFLRPLPDGLPGCKVYEVSPVLLGAGEGTRTLVAKNAPKDESKDNGKRFSDQINTTLDVVNDLIERAKALADLRAKEGRALSSSTRETLTRLSGELLKVASDVSRLSMVPKELSEGLRKEWLRFVQLSNGEK